MFQQSLSLFFQLHSCMCVYDSQDQYLRRTRVSRSLSTLTLFLSREYSLQPPMIPFLSFSFITHTHKSNLVCVLVYLHSLFSYSNSDSGLMAHSCCRFLLKILDKHVYVISYCVFFCCFLFGKKRINQRMCVNFLNEPILTLFCFVVSKNQIH